MSYRSETKKLITEYKIVEVGAAELHKIVAKAPDANPHIREVAELLFETADFNKVQEKLKVVNEETSTRREVQKNTDVPRHDVVRNQSVCSKCLPVADSLFRD